MHSAKMRKSVTSSRPIRSLLLGCVAALLLSACTAALTEAVDPCLEAEDVQVCRFDQSLTPAHPCWPLRLSEIRDVIGGDLGSLPGSREDEGLCFGAYLDDLRFSYTAGPDALAAFASSTAGLADEIATLGENAFWDPAAHTLHVATGSGYFRIEVPAVEDPRNSAVRLAGIALERIRTDREVG